MLPLASVTMPTMPLLTGPVISLPVLAALPRVLYFHAANGVIALVTDPAALPPLGLALAHPDFDLRRTIQGTTVTLGNEQGVVPGLPPFRLTAETERWQPELVCHLPTHIDLTALPPRLHLLTLPFPSDPTLEIVHQRARALFAALRQADHTRWMEAAASLAGLGPGLTPAGDDVLVGTCAALTLLAHIQPTRWEWLPPLRERVGQLATQTTALSATWLEQAAAGRFHRLLIQVVLTLVHHDAAALTLAVRRLGNYGATSGWAMLFGLHHSLSALLH